MTYGTTRKQTELLAFLQERQRVGGAAPSYDEMAAAVGLHSKSGISRMIDALVNRGVIRHLPGHARSIEVVEMPNWTVDEKTELALCNYCHVTGFARSAVIANALREYFLTHPVPQAAGDQR